MPFWGWANFLVPLFRTWPTAQGVHFQNGQYWTSSYYAGVGTAFLVLVAVWRVRVWRVRMLGLGLFVALILSWGDTSALFSILRAYLPGLGFVRYPVKFVILALAVAPLLAAFGIKSLSGRKLGRFEWGCAISLLLLIGLTIAVETRTPETVWSATWHNGLWRGFFLAATVALLCLVSIQSLRLQQVFSWLLLGLFWADLFTHVPNQNPTVDPAVYTSACTGPSDSLGPVRSRVFISPGTRESLMYNSLPDTAANFRRNRSVARANANLLDAIPQVDGFFSLVPRESFELNKRLYSHLEAPPGLLDFMAVSRVTGPGTGCGWVARSTALPIITAGQQPVFLNQRAALEALTNSNTDFNSTVYLPTEARGELSATSQPGARILSPKFENQRITLETETPSSCMVVLSQTYYPTWKAYVDGKATKLWRANYAFQSVQVPAGRHRLEFICEDRSFQLGLFLSAAGLLLVIILACRPTQPNAISSFSGHGQIA